MQPPSSSPDKSTGNAVDAISTVSNSAGLDSASIAELNDKYHSLTIEERLKQLYRDFSQEQVMLTSSFAATSAFLLHVFSRLAPEQQVFFIDTGYHFSQTLEYKKKLTDLYNLKVVDIRAETWKHDFTSKDQTWQSDPNFCCSINKVEPLYEIKKDYDIWVSGLMRWQSAHRASLDIFEERNGIIKFYPLLDVSKEEREAYIKDHNLPFHPLVAQGYSSIGCSHCTKPGDDRSGRWNNSPKTECGLHL
ncbi:Phosphoadenylyl-sulfate reductase [thioredoxin] [hydrothermal vent metagenome]|uniref:Phosphoadenylyl-sulfate reductase [thioredoxin] n=1 Tax=hydrothermal vent metagenome TaxID=652676 RepID=A0A3B0YRJ6_9ZZZZ